MKAALIRPLSSLLRPPYSAGRNLLPMLGWLGLSLALAGGCTSKTDAPQCRVWSDCAGEMACRDGVCVQPVLPKIAKWATQTPTATEMKENVLINGRLIEPPVETVTVGTFPTRMAIHPAGKYVVVNENGWGTYAAPDRDRKAHYVRVLDVVTGEQISELRMPGDRMHIGLRFNKAGTLLYVPGGQDEQLHVFRFNADGTLALESSFPTNNCYGTDVVLSPDESRAYMTCYLSSEVDEIRLSDGGIDTFKAGDWPYELAITPDGARLFVSNAATTFNPEPGDTVTVIDVGVGRVEGIVPVGLGPQSVAITKDGKRLYVANNKTDDIDVIDTSTMKVVNRYALNSDTDGLFGTYPTGIYLDEAANRLYVAGSQENLIAVLDLATGLRLGDITTEWYPTDVEVTPDGKRLAILSGYGKGDGPSNVAGRYSTGAEMVSSGRQLHGSYFSIPTPTDAELAAMSAQVERNNARQSTYFDFSAGNDSALPSPGDRKHESPIKYVFFVFKENFTFDGTYGALGIGNGDPTLQMWDPDLLVNQWALAREFTLFDNFYCNGEGSIDGHEWAVAAIEPDFMQRGMISSYGDLGGPEVVVSLDAGTMPKSRLFLPHLIHQGISVFGYGGLENFGAAGYSEYSPYWMTSYPWNLEVGPRDRERAQMFVDDFKERVENDDVPQFSWIFFPNNHGLGLRAGEPTPESMVADNDEAVGMVVDAVSNSKVWEQSLIIVFEDDGQGAYDHVDKHRCPALAIGPWVKRNYVSSVLYSFPNFHRTVEQIVGSTPMNRSDRDAIAMYDIFTARPDTKPFNKLPRAIPETLHQGAPTAMSRMSDEMDWSDIDRDPRQAEFFWRYLKGTPPPRLPASPLGGDADD